MAVIQEKHHFPGLVPAAAALRAMLAAKGVRALCNGQPFNEAMAFGIAGGIGVGVYSFCYEQADFASFFVAGRHRWQDDSAYLAEACRRFGGTPLVQETAGAKGAETALRAALAEHGPCVAWVDATLLPHRGISPEDSGGGYHVVTVYRIEDGAALIGDLTDEPIRIELADLAAARGRIKKQKHRLLSLASAPAPRPLRELVEEGLTACHAGLTGAGAIGSKTNCSLEALRIWATRLHGSRDRESWERLFPPGHRLWRGLTSIYEYVEHYGTGGGLCRPLFADFLTEAAEALGDQRLRALGEQYAALGRAWSDLADAALPDGMPTTRAAKSLIAEKAELTHSGGSPEEIRALRQRLEELGRAARERFPLGEAACATLRADLQERVMALYEGEVAAHARLGELVA
jgi:hypothetical protein